MEQQIERPVVACLNSLHQYGVCVFLYCQVNVPLIIDRETQADHWSNFLNIVEHNTPQQHVRLNNSSLILSLLVATVKSSLKYGHFRKTHLFQCVPSPKFSRLT